MATKFFATANADTFTNPSHSVFWHNSDFGLILNEGPYPDADEPYNGIVEGLSSGNIDPVNFMHDFINSHGFANYYFEVFDDNSVDYSFSTAPVSIDLTQATQHGGFAEGRFAG